MLCIMFGQISMGSHNKWRGPADMPWVDNRFLATTGAEQAGLNPGGAQAFVGVAAIADLPSVSAAGLIESG